MDPERIKKLEAKGFKIGTAEEFLEDIMAQRVLLTVSVPTTVATNLEKIASKRDFSSVEALLRFYIGQGLRKDLTEESNQSTE